MNNTSVRIVLPHGPVEGLVLAGYPMRVTGFDGHIEAIGLFVDSLQVAGLTISNFQTPHHLRQALRQYEKLPRTLTLSYVVSESTTTLYGITLPATNDLGIHLKGFPPVIAGIRHDSVVSGQFQVGQVIERLLIPSKSVDMSLYTGGFTDRLVVRTLSEYAQADDRQLIVKNEKPPPAQKGSNAPFDWGSFRNPSLKAMFSRPSAAQRSALEEPAAEEVNVAFQQDFVPLVKAELL